MKNKNIIIIIVAIFVVSGLLTLTSFAYFTATVQGNDSAYNTVITTGEMALMLNDGEQVGLNNAIPGDSITKEFSVKNTGTVETTYDVYFSELFNTFEDKNDLVYKLETSNGCANDTEKIVPSISSDESKMVSACTINPNQTHNYTLTITFKNDGTNQDDNKGKKFSTKVSLNEYKRYVTKARLSSTNTFKCALANMDENECRYVSDFPNVERIEMSSNMPSVENNAKLVSADDSDFDVFVWNDNSTSFIYTDADYIEMPTNSNFMFAHLSNLKYLDLQRFDPSNVISMEYLFAHTGDFEVNIGEKFNTEKLEDVESLFYKSYISNVDFLNNFDFSKVKSTYRMFDNMLGNVEINLHDIVFNDATNANYMFTESSGIKSISLSNISFPNATSARYMISSLKNIEHISFSGLFDGSNLTEINYFIYNNPKLQSVDLGDNFLLTNLSHMYYFITFCDSLVNIDFGKNFDISNITEIDDMLYHLPVITEIDFKNFLDLSKATRISLMVENCDNLKTIHIGNKFTFGPDANLNCIFDDLINLETIYAGPHSYSDENNETGVFCNVPSLKGGAGTTFDKNYRSIEYARIDDPEHGKPGYFTLDPRYQ